MADYDKEDNKRGKYTVFGIICAFIYLIFNHFFGYSETMTCSENHCDIYKVKNSNKVSHLHKSFDEQDIAGYDVIRTGGRRIDENTTYIPVVILKDGSKIPLRALETRNYTEANHTTFISLRNKKFPK